MKYRAMVMIVAGSLLLAAAAAGGAQLSNLLTSSAWCSFQYNKTTGYSSTTRYQFLKNGTFFSGGQSEGYSSGAGGTYASQGNKRNGGTWKLSGNVLHLVINGAPQEPVGLQVKKSGNGPVVIVAAGTEYVACK